jgi:hypothetical protein
MILSPDAVAEAMMLALKDDSNGSVWTVIRGVSNKLDITTKYF